MSAHTISSLIAGFAWFLYTLHFWRVLCPFMPVYLRRLGAALLLFTAFLILMDDITHTKFEAGKTIGKLFGLDGERNIPAAFTASLMSTAGMLALRLAINTRSSNSSAHQRLMSLYWLGFGIGFFLLAMDEYLFQRHERSASLRQLYHLSGLLMGSLTIVIFFFWERPARRRYLLWLILGLVISSSGAFFLELRRLLLPCVNELWVWRSFLCPSRDIHFVPLEETLEILGMLTVGLALLSYAAAQTNSGAKVARPLSRRGGASQLAQVVILLLAAYFASRQLDSVNPKPHSLISISVNWGDQIPTLRSFWLGWRWRTVDVSGKVGAEAPRVFLNFFHAGQPVSDDFGHTFALVDQVTGTVYAKRDEWNRRLAADWRPERRSYEQEYSFPILADIPTHRALWLTIQLWQQEEGGSFRTLPIHSSTRATLSDTEAVLTEWMLERAGPAEEKPSDPLGHFGNHLTLRHAAFPAQSHAGETLSIEFHWGSNDDLNEDWTQFLHFVHEESSTLWNHDQPPLGARLPTRLWYTGLADQETWQFTLPADLPPGRYRLYTGLYRLSDMMRMTVVDDLGDPLPDARLPLGSIEIKSPQEESDG